MSYLEGVRNVLNGIGAHLQSLNLILSCISVIINVFHLFILSRKAMKTSSTNVILIGLSISDIFIMLTTVYKYFAMVDKDNPDCMTSDSCIKLYIDLILWGIQLLFRRCGCWLGVLMASVRYLIVRKLAVSRNSNWSKPSGGWVMVITVFCISTLQSTFFQSRYMVVENRSVPLPLICADLQNIYRSPQYSLMIIPFFSFNKYIVLRSFMFFDAFTTKFIPCIAFPILTVSLLRALRRMKESGGNSGRKISVSNEEKKELTTKLIVFMTIAFFITEAPMGIIYLVKAFFDRNATISILSTDLIVYFSLLVTINSILHPIFCLCMSSQYRDTIRKLLAVRRKPTMSSTRNKTSVVSVQSIQMT